MDEMLKQCTQLMNQVGGMGPDGKKDDGRHDGGKCDGGRNDDRGD